MSFIKFIRSKYFFKQLGIAIILTIFLIWLSLRLLDLFTLHGSYITVPDFKGVLVEELDNFSDSHDLKYVIIDSVYDLSLKKGTIALQDPMPNSKVKKNRTIYLTVVSSTAEEVKMPNLLDLTLRQAIAMLESFGLQVGTLKYVPDIARNAVLRQRYKGKDIAEGSIIDKGSRVDLILGIGNSNDRTIIPNLFGKSQMQATRLLQDASLNVGAEIFEDGNDTSSSRVYKQDPAANSSSGLGQSVNLRYKSSKKYDFNKPLKNK